MTHHNKNTLSKSTLGNPHLNLSQFWLKRGTSIICFWTMMRANFKTRSEGEDYVN